MAAVAYREDSEALLARADALEIDLQEAEAKLTDATESNAELEAEAQRLRDEVAALRAKLPEEKRPPMGSAMRPPADLPLTTTKEPVIPVGAEDDQPGLHWGHLFALILVVLTLLGLIVRCGHG